MTCVENSIGTKVKKYCFRVSLYAFITIPDYNSPNVSWDAFRLPLSPVKVILSNVPPSLSFHESACIHIYFGSIHLSLSPSAANRSSRFSALWWTHDYTKNRCRPQRYKLEWNRLGRKREGWNPESRHDLYFCLFAIRLPIQYRWLCIHMAFCHFGRYRPILGFQIAALDSWEIGNSSLYLNVNI